MNDIKEAKGRKTRKIFTDNFRTNRERVKDTWGAERVKAGDPAFTKYLVKKEKAHGHH